MPARAMIRPANRWIEILVVAIFFALSGLASGLILSGSGSRSNGVDFSIPWNVYLVGVPFGLVSALVFSNSPRLAPALLVLNSAAWVAAFLSLLAVATANQYLAVCVPGFVGGVCVAAATGIGSGNPLRIRRIAIVALVGSVTGLAFFNGPDGGLPPWRIYADFALWQSAVGVTLYALSAR
jgi:hypothetical protein